MIRSVRDTFVRIKKSVAIDTIVSNITYVLCLISLVFSLFLSSIPITFAATIDIDAGVGAFVESINDPDQDNTVLTLTGAGYLCITGQSTHKGSTSIGSSTGPPASPAPTPNGNLFVLSGGSVGNNDVPFVVEQPGSVFGGGTIHGKVTNKGIISPGNNNNTAPGSTLLGAPALPVGTTMAIKGSYTSKGGIIQLYFNPSSSDRLDITGNADFSSGQIYITPVPANYGAQIGSYQTAITWTGTGPMTLPTISTNSSLDLTITPSFIGTTPNYTGIQFTYTPGAPFVLYKDLGGSEEEGPTNNINNPGPYDAAFIKNVTGPIIANDGAKINTINPGSHTITNQISLVEGGTLTVMPYAASTIEFKGSLISDKTSTIAISGSGINSVVTISGDASRLNGNIQATNTKVLVNATTPASVSVGSGAMLSGSGAMGAVTATSGSILKPGNSIGTITFDSLTASGANYQVEMNENAANKIVVNNSATLGDNTSIATNFVVDILMDADTYIAGTKFFPILTSAMLTGGVQTLTWTDQPNTGLVFDIDTSTANTVNLIRTIGTSFTLNSDQC